MLRHWKNALSAEWHSESILRPFWVRLPLTQLGACKQRSNPDRW